LLFKEYLFRKRTCLYEFHLQNGAKMVEFAGFSMPGKYGDLSISESVKHTRSGVSLFDVSHMMQVLHSSKYLKIIFTRRNCTGLTGCFIICSQTEFMLREDFIESLTTADVKQMPENTGTLSVFTNSEGGVIDDLVSRG
jgi:aminomethyltransferase